MAEPTAIYCAACRVRPADVTRRDRPHALRAFGVLVVLSSVAWIVIGLVFNALCALLGNW